MAGRSSTELPTTSRKRKGDESWGSTTGQDVLNLAVYKYLQTTEASNPKDVNGFVYYLQHVRKVVIVDVQPGSLIITVECGSLQKLEELWDDYCTGYVSEMAQKFLLTKHILNELGLSKVKLSTSIPREKYRAACHELLRVDSGEYNYFYQYVISPPLIRTHFSRSLVESGSFFYIVLRPTRSRLQSLEIVTRSSWFKNLCYANQIRKKVQCALHKSVFFACRPCYHAFTSFHREGSFFVGGG